MNRREFLAALACVGCFPRRAPELPSSGPLTLGWRLVPGLETTYRSRITRVMGEQESTRVEQWAYLVRSVDENGVADLEGRLTGLGIGSQRAGETPERRALEDLPERERQRVMAERVALRIDREGRLLELRSGPDFADQIRHYLLALRLPRGAVVVHDEWGSPELAELFSTLLPASLDVRCESAVRLAELTPRPSGLLVELATTDRVDVARGPALDIQGYARWDARRGNLLSRTLTARFARGLPGSTTSTLNLHLERIA